MQGHSISKKKDYNILASIGALLTSFEIFDKWSGYLSSVLEGGVDFLQGNGLWQSRLKSYSGIFDKFGKGMIILGSILSWGNSVYNNFNNPNYTTGEAITASFMDAGYYAIKGIGTYFLGKAVGDLAVAAGIFIGAGVVSLTSALGLCVGGALFAGIIVGGVIAIAIAVLGSILLSNLGEWADEKWNEIKRKNFE